MRPNVPYGTLIALSSIFIASHALPFSSHPRVPQPEPTLRPRAAYSVVPVDGGLMNKPTTVVETITWTKSTPPQSTRTVLYTDVEPGDTATLVSTVTIDGPEPTETIRVTLTPSVPTVVFESIVPTTIIVTEQVPEATSLTTSSRVSSPVGFSSSRTPCSSGAIPTSSLHSTISLKSSSPTTTIGSLTSVSTATPQAPEAYDDGMWHAPWSNRTASALTP